MNGEVKRRLLEINREFYEVFGDAFAATRRRIQAGIYRLLEEEIAPRSPLNWLDLGCGSGALGQEWHGRGIRGVYTGMDFSGPLLKEAERTAGILSDGDLSLRYVYGDLMDPQWTDPFPQAAFDGISAFASLHHIPGTDEHQRIFRQVNGLLKQGGLFVLSVWQFQNSPKLMARIQPWERVRLDPALLEAGDTLLDWRYALPGQKEEHGLRYVHLFSEEALRSLALQTGFEPVRVFRSDGKEGNLALYAIFMKK